MIGGLVHVRAHTRQDPKRLRRSKRKRFQSLDKLKSVISTGREAITRRKKRRRLRPVGAGYDVMY